MAFRTNKTPVLQTKSASGSVATFNTALAMPLVNGEFTIQAYQEGSGDPSPDNVRNIIPFNTQKITKTGKNFVKNDWESGYISPTGQVVYEATSHHTKLIKVKSGAIYCYSGLTKATSNKRLHGYDINGNWVAQLAFVSIYEVRIDVPFQVSATIPSNVKYVKLSNGVADENIQLEVGSEATAYEPYVTPTIYTIQLGQEVYGAEVDVVNGVAHVKWIKKVITSVEGWSYFSSFQQAYSTDVLVSSGYKAIDVDKAYLMCENLKPINVNERTGNVGNFIFLYNQGNGLSISVPNSTSIADTQAWIKDNPVTLIYEISEPFDIQLTPTQIETLIGNNTIFCDTGDIDLTYKDLDIAKRGNFREVFRLPS